MNHFAVATNTSALPAPSSPVTETRLYQQIATEIQAKVQQVEATVVLLDGGASVPFIARYRKEATQGLDDVQLRTLEERLQYLRDLTERRQTILQSIHTQGKLTDALRQAIEAAATKQALEDLYQPFKIQKRSKAQMAKAAGLEPLALALFRNPLLDPETEAQAYVSKPLETKETVSAATEGASSKADCSSVAAVLIGARDILAQSWAEDANIVQDLREWLWQTAQVQARSIAAPDSAEALKFKDYFDYSEALAQAPSHRALALLRGRSLNILEVKIAIPAPDSLEPEQLAISRLSKLLSWRDQGRAADAWLSKCVTWTWRVKLLLTLERDLITRLREQAETTAIKVFAGNLRHLLLAAPAGKRVVMGLDPGIRTGVKVALVDETGKLLQTATVYPHQPKKDWDGALHTLETLCRHYQVNLIAIGNGTASRETEQLAAAVCQRMQQAESEPRHVDKIVVSEAGASVYSASGLASTELPDIDVSLRGAVSIARRVQDPLAEFVKIDPKAIGVGQYQHDVNQTALARSLDTVVEDCVNAVGVELNTASVPLLARVSGLGTSSARKIVQWREQNGTFSARSELLKVPGLGAKTFELSAGFLRIAGASNPLDNTGVHPEAYAAVTKLLQASQQQLQAILGDKTAIQNLKNLAVKVAPELGSMTLTDICTELEKPGRDPRPHFEVIQFAQGINDIKDLRLGMVLEGVVSNVAAFGAFIDIGVHQDGLVHVSQMAQGFVKDAAAVVKVGDRVKVKVLEIDLARKRISLSFRMDSEPTRAQTDPTQPKSLRKSGSDTKHTPTARHPQKFAPKSVQTTMGAAFDQLRKRP